MTEHFKNMDFMVALLLLLVVVGCMLILWSLHRHGHLLRKSTPPTGVPNTTEHPPSGTDGQVVGQEHFQRLQNLYLGKQNELTELAKKHKNTNHEHLNIEALQNNLTDDKRFYAQVYTNTDATLYAHQQAPDLLYKIYKQDHKLIKGKAALGVLLQLFNDDHQEKKYAYQRQVAKLGSSYDQLKKELQKGTIPRNKQEWAHQYCQIFDQWIEKGSQHNIDKLKEQITAPIQQLNEDYPNNEFTPVLNSDAKTADMMHKNIKQLPQRIVQKLEELGQNYGKNSALIGQMIHKTTALYEHVSDTHTPSTTAVKNDQTSATITKRGTGFARQLLPSSKNGVLRKYGRPVGLIFLLVSAYYGFSRYHESGKAQITTNSPIASDSTKYFLSLKQHYLHLADYMTAQHRQSTNDSTDWRSPRKSTTDMAPYYGIDVSHLQHDINWEAIEQNRRKIDFAIIKATEGTHWRDPFFIKNWQAAKARFPVVGVYHYFNKNNPTEQALNFIAQVPKDTLSNQFFPIVDVESDRYLVRLAKNGQLIENLRVFIKQVETHYGRQVIVYSGQDFYQKYLRGYLPGQLFWLAHYCQCDDIQDLIQRSIDQPKSAERIVAWQFTDKGQVNGIKGNVDLNYVPAYFWQQVVNGKSQPL